MAGHRPNISFIFSSAIFFIQLKIYVKCFCLDFRLNTFQYIRAGDELVTNNVQSWTITFRMNKIIQILIEISPINIAVFPGSVLTCT